MALYMLYVYVLYKYTVYIHFKGLDNSGKSSCQVYKPASKVNFVAAS